VPTFSYKARDAAGALQQGTLDGVDSGAVADQLLRTGLSPIEIAPAAKSGGAGAVTWLNGLLQEPVRAVDVQFFSRQMYTLQKAGVPMFRALAGLQESAINKSFARVLQDLRESLDAGRELSAAMRRHPTVFSPFYLSMVRIGEMTGRLEEIFLRLFDHLEFERERRARIRAALRYPSFVAIAITVAMAVVNLFVIPAFAKVYAGFNTQLPLMTRILLGASDFTVRFWPLLVAVAIFAVVGFRMYVGTASGRFAWDRRKLRIPLAGEIILKATLARFARSFALAARSGVPLVQALGVVALVVDNSYIASRIEHMREGVERGESILRTATATGVFTPVVVQMIAVGEETGEIDDLMDEIAAMYEREVEYQVKTLSARIEPILIVFLGVLVLILALGIFLPIWDLGKAAMHR
jgi:MSHA biogenesis protein MshG